MYDHAKKTTIDNKNQQSKTNTNTNLPCNIPNSALLNLIEKTSQTSNSNNQYEMSKELKQKFKRNYFSHDRNCLKDEGSNVSGLPDNLKTGIENLSGMDMSNVKVHYNSNQPAALGALAYTRGTNIYVAPGQEKHIPHEAWHVVQQSRGRVMPTLQMKGSSISDDSSLEREANTMGECASRVGSTSAARQRSIESSAISAPTGAVTQFMKAPPPDKENRGFFGYIWDALKSFLWSTPDQQTSAQRQEEPETKKPLSATRETSAPLLQEEKPLSQIQLSEPIKAVSGESLSRSLSHTSEGHPQELSPSFFAPQQELSESPVKLPAQSPDLLKAPHSKEGGTKEKYHKKEPKKPKWKVKTREERPAAASPKTETVLPDPREGYTAHDMYKSRICVRGMENVEARHVNTVYEHLFNGNFHQSEKIKGATSSDYYLHLCKTDPTSLYLVTKDGDQHFTIIGQGQVSDGWHDFR